MKSQLTKREIFVIVFFIFVLLPIFIFIPQARDRDNEVFFLIFFVAPLGLLIATDPERMKK